jgi:hypothetical protein
MFSNTRIRQDQPFQYSRFRQGETVVRSGELELSAVMGNTLNVRVPERRFAVTRAAR